MKITPRAKHFNPIIQHKSATMHKKMSKNSRKKKNKRRAVNLEDEEEQEKVEALGVVLLQPEEEEEEEESLELTPEATLAKPPAMMEEAIWREREKNSVPTAEDKLVRKSSVTDPVPIPTPPPGSRSSTGSSSSTMKAMGATVGKSIASSAVTTAALSSIESLGATAAAASLVGRAQLQSMGLIALKLPLASAERLEQLSTAVAAFTLEHEASIVQLTQMTTTEQIFAAGFQSNAVATLAAAAVQESVNVVYLCQGWSTREEFNEASVAVALAGTGSLAGAVAGAAVGTLIVPGAGTVIGSLIGSFGGSFVPGAALAKTSATKKRAGEVDPTTCRRETESSLNGTQECGEAEAEAAVAGGCVPQSNDELSALLLGGVVIPAGSDKAQQLQDDELPLPLEAAEELSTVSSTTTRATATATVLPHPAPIHPPFPTTLVYTEGAEDDPPLSTTSHPATEGGKTPLQLRSSLSLPSPTRTPSLPPPRPFPLLFLQEEPATQVNLVVKSDEDAGYVGSCAEQNPSRGGHFQQLLVVPEMGGTTGGDGATTIAQLASSTSTTFHPFSTTPIMDKKVEGEPQPLISPSSPPRKEGGAEEQIERDNAVMVVDGSGAPGNRSSRITLQEFILNKPDEPPQRTSSSSTLTSFHPFTTTTPVPSSSSPSPSPSSFLEDGSTHLLAPHTAAPDMGTSSTQTDHFMKKLKRCTPRRIGRIIRTQLFLRKKKRHAKEEEEAVAAVVVGINDRSTTSFYRPTAGRQKRNRDWGEGRSSGEDRREEHRPVVTSQACEEQEQELALAAIFLRKIEGRKGAKNIGRIIEQARLLRRMKRRRGKKGEGETEGTGGKPHK